MGRKPCDECERVFAITRWDTPAEREKKKSGPPCATCRPELLDGNLPAYDMYVRCAGQLILGPGGEKIDINVQAVKIVMDLEGVRDQAETLEKVQRLARVIFREQGKEAERRREADKQDRRR